MEKIEWVQVDRIEQETTICIDYYDKTIKLCTNRKAVYDKLVKRGLEARDLPTIDGKVCGAIFVLPLTDKNSAWLLSRPTVICSFSKSSD